MAENVIARKDSQWLVISQSPDVCKTPIGPATPPIPYPVTAELAGAVQPVPSVVANGAPVVVLTQSFIPKTKGDEPGTAKGIKSGTVGDICEPLAHSSTVKIGGFPALRHNDLFWMNNKNTLGKIFGQPPATSVPASESNPPVIPETPAELSYAEAYKQAALQQRLDDPSLHTDGVGALGFAKQAWNTPVEMVSQYGKGQLSVMASNMSQNAAIQRSLGFTDVADSLDKSSDYLSSHLDESAQAVDSLKFPLNNNSERLGAQVFDITFLLFGGEIAGTAKMATKVPSLVTGFARGGSLAREGETTAKFTSELLNVDKAADVASDAAAAGKTAEKTVPPARDGTIVRSEEQKAPGKGEQVETSTCTTAGDPVDVATGDLLQPLSVLELPGILPLKLTRSYRSRSTKRGLFGQKWTDEWSCTLVIHDNQLHFTTHEGAVLCYRIPQDGNFQDVANSRQTRYRLNGKAGKALTLFDRRTRQTQVFSQAGSSTYLLSALHDNHGNRIDFIRADSLLTEIRHSDGYSLTLDWLNQQLMSIDLVTPQRQRLVTCQYDDNGFLAECDTFQFTHLWHDYTPEGWMTRWRDTDKTSVEMRYDTRGRVTETLAEGGFYADRFVYHDDEQHTTYLDAEGGESHYWYNEDGLVIRQSDALGRETLSQWENTRLLSRTDPLGRITRYAYDADGQRTRLSLPDGLTFHYRWNNEGQLTEWRSTAGQRWALDYDEQGSLSALTDNQGRRQQFSYSEHGDLLSQMLPDGTTWRWQYNTRHQLAEIITPDNAITRTESDFFGRLLSVQDPLSQTTRFHHSPHHASPAGSTEEIIRPDGVRELMHQDSEKRPESVTDGEGKTTRYEYGAFDLLTAIIRPDGERLECRYDKLTRLTGIISAAGESYHLTYDAAGQLISDTDFTGRTLRYEYDAAGRRICTRYPDNHLIREYYDHGDRLIRKQTFQLTEGHELPGVTTEYRYDAQHRMVSARHPDALVEFEYDAAGSVTAEILNGRRTEYARDPLNGRPLSWQLDTLGMTFAHGPAGKLTRWQVNGHEPLYLTHDAAGRETHRYSPAGFQLSQRHSPTGMLLDQWTGPAGAQDISRHFGYDRAYNVTTLSDNRWGETRYRYDNNARIVQATGDGRHPLQEEVFRYDVNHNLREHGLRLSNVALQFIPQNLHSGRVLKRGNDTYRYDTCGRLITKLVLRGGFRPAQWRYRWDDLGQLSELITPQGERWQYRYDPFGRRISKRRLNTTTGIAGYDFHWSGDQLVAETPVYADGTVATEKSIYWLYEPGVLTPGARYEKGELHYVLRDHMGTPRELLTETGQVVWAQKLSVWGKAQHWHSGAPAANEEARSPDCPWRFAGQYADEESGLHYNRFRYYDNDTGQYVSPDPIGLAGGVNPYGYVSNPLKYVDPLGLCKDSFGRQKVLNNIDASRKARESSNFSNFNEWPPNRGFSGDSSQFTLLPGTKIDRYGSEYGTFLSPEGTPYRARSLKPGTDGKPYNVYVVKKPITVEAGDAAPWFGYEGGGTQYESPNRVIDLINNGSLERLRFL